MYIVLCADGSYYTGVTSRLEYRIGQHQFGFDKAAYTTRRPISLAWSQEFANVDDAIRSEKKIQGWSRAKKEALIAGNWPLVRSLSRSRGRN